MSAGDARDVHLPALHVGEAARVTALTEPDSPAACKLASMGLGPGAEVTLVHRYPDFVLRTGGRELALSPELAGHILVCRAAAPPPAV